jgi:hypothetical protein
MNGVSTFRLYVLRATYLLLVVGLGIQIWPGILDPPRDLEHMRSVVRSLLGAVALLAVLGLRYPLRMLPLLLFELVWKSIWVLAFGLPLWSAGALAGGTRETWNDCLVSIVLFLLVIPWGYVLAQYVKQPGDGWRSISPPGVTSEPSVAAASPMADPGRGIV